MKTLYTILCTAMSLLLLSAGVISAQWNQSQISNAQDLNMFATVGNRIIAGTYGTGVYVSDDKCKTWKEANTGLDNGLIYTVYTDKNKVYVTTEGSGIYVSSNGGDTWTGIGPANKMVMGMTIIDGVIYAGVYQSGVMISTDNGVSWTISNNGLTNLIVKTLHYDGSTLYAGSWGGGVFTSNDKGQNWAVSNKGSAMMSVWNIRQADSNVVIMGQGGIYLTGDHGKNWKSMGNGAMAQVVTGFAQAGNSYFAVSPGTGVFVSTDKGDSWKDFSEGLPDPNIRVLNVSGNTLLGGAGTGLVVYRDISSYTSVEEPLASVNDIDIYPNPAIDRCVIRLKTESSDNSSYLITDLVGNIYLSGEILTGDNVRIDCSVMPQGSYMVVVNQGSQRIVRKFSVVR